MTKLILLFSEHVFEVSSGLDSLFFEECQILAHVKQVVKVDFGRNISGFEADYQPLSSQLSICSGASVTKVNNGTQLVSATKFTSKPSGHGECTNPSLRNEARA
uniref:Uncharacterized protein n=1 Tax=Brassica campestris TaxID=3711 RepID=M4CVQ6_BRACM